MKRTIAVLGLIAVAGVHALRGQDASVKAVLQSTSDVTITVMGVTELPPALAGLAPGFQPYTMVFAQGSTMGRYAFTLMLADGKPVTTVIGVSHRYSADGKWSAGAVFTVDPRSVVGVSVAPLLQVSQQLHER